MWPGLLYLLFSVVCFLFYRSIAPTYVYITGLIIGLAFEVYFLLKNEYGIFMKNDLFTYVPYTVNVFAEVYNIVERYKRSTLQTKGRRVGKKERLDKPKRNYNRDRSIYVSYHKLIALFPKADKENPCDIGRETKSKDVIVRKILCTSLTFP